MNLSPFLNGVFLCLLTAILCFLFSSSTLKWSRPPVHDNPPPYRAQPEAVERTPTLSTTIDPPKPEERQSKDRLSSDPARTIETKAAQDAAGASSAPDYGEKTRHRPTCFRITSIPLNWGKNELKKTLAQINLDVDLEGVELSIFPACSTKTQTVLLRLDRNIAYFEGWKQSQEKQLPFKEQGKTKLLNIDKDFYGLTPLNSPDAPITAELVSLRVLENCQAR
jgi:hypothetical protein